MARSGASNTRGGVRDLTDSHTSGMPQGSGGVSGGGNGQPFTLSPIPDGDVLGNIIGSTAAPVGVTLSALLDHVIGNTRGSIITRTAASWVILAPGSAGTFLEANGAGADLGWGVAGAGTVTSVALTMPAQFGVSGSPVTGAGTLAVAWNTEAANLVLAGPSSGSAAVPIFRALAAADLPLATLSAFGAVKPDGTTITISGGVISSSGGGGGVTSVGLSLPADFTVSGSPVTTSGTLTAVWANESAHVVHAGPASGGAAAPTWRALVAADLPVATSSAFGAVEPDNTTITIAAGIISAVSGLPVPLNKFLAVPANPGFDPNFAGIPGVTWTISNNNRTAIPASGSPYNHIMGTPARYTGKAYWECVQQDASFGGVGIVGGAGHRWNGGGAQLGNVTSIPGQLAWLPVGQVKTMSDNAGGPIVLTTIQTWAAGNRLSIAVDLDNLLIWFRTTTGNWNNSGTANPATGVGGISLAPALSGADSWLFWPAMNSANPSAAINMYLNSADFIESVPAGYGSWSSL